MSITAGIDRSVLPKSVRVFAYGTLVAWANIHSMIFLYEHMFAPNQSGDVGLYLNLLILVVVDVGGVRAGIRMHCDFVCLSSSCSRFYRV